MKKYSFIFLVYLCFLGCDLSTPIHFSDKANSDLLTSLAGKKSTFKQVIDQYQGKKVFIDLWASWCADCVKGMPVVKQLQESFPEVVFLFISVDKKDVAWKNGIQRFQIKGEHYNLPKGMNNGAFIDFIGLNWIPRYMIVDKNGSISLFKATNSSDKRILEALK